MTELVGTGLVKCCECSETPNAILHWPRLENFDGKPPHVFGQGVVGQSGGCPMAERTLSLKDSTVWSEAGSHVPRSQKDPRSWIPRIQDPGSCRILNLTLSFSHGILEILETVTTTFSWDPRDLGSQTE